MSLKPPIGTNDTLVTLEDVLTSGRIAVLTLSRVGTLTATAGNSRFLLPRGFTVLSVSASVGTAPSGGTVVVDVNRNGTTIFTTQANRPTIADGQQDSDAETPDVTSLPGASVLTVDVDTVTAPAADLTVLISGRWAP